MDDEAAVVEAAFESPVVSADFSAGFDSDGLVSLDDFSDSMAFLRDSEG